MNSGALLNFELADTSASDKIAMTNSTLSLSGQQFSDFSFTPLSGFGQGKYILIDANNVQGSLGANLSGLIGGLPASLSISGNDLILTVVPEPSSIRLLTTGVLIFFGYAWRTKRFHQLAFLLMAAPALGAGITRADVLNMPAEQTSKELVTVGNPNNLPDTPYIQYGGQSFGAVPYTFAIGKYEITAGQYCEFLNAVAATDTYGLYNQYMDYDADSNRWGCNIKRTGSSGSYSYIVAADWANRPVNYVSWGDAARFCNWLYNGQPNGSQDFSTTEDGSYYLNGATSAEALIAVMRKSSATWVIPSEDEWYKAAYHKNDGVTGNYWHYPTSTDNVPSNALISPDPGNNANFVQNHAYTIGIPYFRTEVGEFENSESPYGTFDQGGNVWEWNETAAYTDFRVLRGGGVSDLDGGLSSPVRWTDSPSIELNSIGFRVAFVPEPSSLVLLGMAAICFLAAGFLKMVVQKLFNRKRHLPGFFNSVRSRPDFSSGKCRPHCPSSTGGTSQYSLKKCRENRTTETRRTQRR